MLKLLLKKQLFEIFRSYFYDAKKNKARSRLATALYIGLFVLLMAGILGGIFTLLAVKLCGPLAAAGLGWLYFALTGGIAVLLGAFGSIFNTYAGLYLPKDNDLLLSMPVPVSSLVAARLSGVYLMGLMYSAVVILPAVVVYWATVGITVSAVLGGLVLTLLISLAVLVLSCALGWVAAKISQKLRNKSLVVVLASLVFIACITSSISRPRASFRTCWPTPGLTAPRSGAGPIPCTCSAAWARAAGRPCWRSRRQWRRCAA